MPTIPHIERHFAATAAVCDIVISRSDGLTVPLALAAGLIITAGLAEVAAAAAFTLARMIG